MATSRFVRLSGKSRRYLDTETGLEVSRRQRDAIIDREHGGRAKRDIATAAKHRQKMQAYKYQTAQYAREHGLSKKAARESEGFKEAQRDLMRGDARSVTRALKAMGMREGIPDYVKPGETEAFLKSGTMDKPSRERRSFWASWRKNNLQLKRNR